MKKNKNRERERYDIDELTSFIEKNSVECEPVEYNADKMAVFGANINLKRHILEIKDGLKPVQRRILLAMYENKLYPGKLSKSAQVVGDVLKIYHQLLSGWLRNSNIAMHNGFRTAGIL